MPEADALPLRLTQLSHGGGCGCKIAPAVLQQIIGRGAPGLLPKDLLVGFETADDAAVYRINERQAIVATTDFFTPIVDDPYDFGAIAAANAISDVYAMGATPLFALALVGMPVDKLPVDTIRRILEGGESVCAKAGIPIAGGHTIDAAEPIYGLVAIGIVDPRTAEAQCRRAARRPAGAGQAARHRHLQRRAEAGTARTGALRDDDRQHDAAQYPRHHAWHDGIRARADRRHGIRPPRPSARSVPRLQAPPPRSTSDGFRCIPACSRSPTPAA